MGIRVWIEYISIVKMKGLGEKERGKVRLR